AATAPADPSRAGYTFTGWDVDFSNVTSNLTVTAQYEQNSSQGEGHWEWKPVTTIIPDEDYLIGFVASGVTYLAVNYNDTATNHYYNSYTASGSSTAHWLGYTAIATIENDLVVGCTGNVTNLDYCVWNFSSATGGTITSGYESGRYLQTATSVTTYQDLYPGTTSSNAANWVWNSTDKTLTRTVSGTTVYAEHASAGGTGHYMGVFTSRTASEYVQLYHKEWVEEQVTVMHTVTFVDGYNGSIIAAHTVEDGAAMPATPATPDHSADNYYFVRWNPDPANYTTVTEDLTFTAYYEFQQTGYYLVTFKDWNGRVLSTQTVAEGDPASAPADPSRPGYNFTGWDKDFSNITSNLVVYATYSKTVSMAYTVTLQATYGPRVTQEKTHITWHSNNGSGEYKNSKDVIMNEDIPVEYPEGTAPSGAKVSWTEGGDLVWEDHVFLGWARVTIGNKDDGIYPEFDPENPAYVEERTYGESDLFLKYVSPTGSETQGKFLAQNPSTGNWVEVENVAADELMPYHGMYAVWGTVFYVYHSGTGVVEKRVITKDDGAYNLTQNIDNAYLYGGYYKAYAGVSTGYDSKALGWDDILVVRSADGSIDTSASKWYQTDNDNGVGAVKYDGSNATWVYDQAYKTTDENAETGLAITPVAGTTYYIKEVPAAKYLRPYLHYTYYLESGSISTAWLISDVDDLNYQQTGFRIVSADKKAEDVVSSLTVSTSNGSSTIKLTPKRVFGAKGYLSYLTVINHGSNGEPVVNLLSDNSAVMQYWVTPDGLFVSGTVSREYTGLGNVSDIGFTPTEGSSTIEVFRGNN
ncbi:MAG: InlB B-repeat-containing protein, partial [Clostridia bacterium]|nr:InlB B-repeat-containing protein [Clostridia bacterium]